MTTLKKKKRYQRKYRRPRTQVAREKRAKEKAALEGSNELESGSESEEEEEEEEGVTEAESDEEGNGKQHLPTESSPRKRSISEVEAGEYRDNEQDGSTAVDRPREELKKARTDEWTDDRTLVKPEGGHRNKSGRKIKKPKKDQRVYPEITLSPQRLNGWVKNVDLQQLALYILADGTGPSWILVKNRPAIKRVVVLLVPGLSLDLFDGHIKLPSLSRKEDDIAPPISAKMATEEPAVDKHDVEDLISQTQTLSGSALAPKVVDASMSPHNKMEDIESAHDAPKPLGGIHDDGSSPHLEKEAPPVDSEVKLPEGSGAHDDISKLSEDGESEARAENAADEGEKKKRNPNDRIFIAKHEFAPVPLNVLPKSDAVMEMKKMFTHIFPTKAGGDNNRIFSPVQNILKVPVPAKKQQQRQNSQKQNQRLKISMVCLTPEEMIEHEYPVHSTHVPKVNVTGISSAVSNGDGWMETNMSTKETISAEAGSVTEGRRVLALDCEMVKSATGSELARISIVDWDGKIIYDELVKPDVEVIDYVTMYSGITASMLKDVTTTRADVQLKLQEILTPSTVLVGHSLNMDLHALRYAHPHIVDTAIIYDCSRGKPYKPSLKWLTQKYLKREIQKYAPATKGHDSVEDAIACLELLKAKLDRGRQFGTLTADEESIFQRFERVQASGGVVDYGNPAGGHGFHAKVNVACTSDAEVCAGIEKCVNGEVHTGTVPVNFVWGRLVALEKARNWKSNWQIFSQQVFKMPMTADSPPIEIPPLPPSPSVDELSKAVHETVEHISKIYESLPKCTAFIVYSGTGDPREMARLNAIHGVYKKEFTVKKWDQLSVKWTDDEEQALRQATNIARKGIAFITVT